MAVNILAIVKAVLPYATQIATTAIPHFTRPDAARVDPAMARQIEELQAAATQNATQIHVIAEQLQQAARSGAEAAEMARRQLAIYRTLLFVSLAASAGSLACSLYLLAR